jgi:integrase
MLGTMEGMRKGEICGVKWRMIDLDRGTVAVSPSIEQTKAGAERRN